MSDPFIDHLVEDLVPRRPLNRLMLVYGVFAMLLLLAGGVVVIGGIRPDYEVALQGGAMIWKPGLFLLISCSAFWVLSALSRPTGRIERKHYLPLIGVTLIYGWQLAEQLQDSSLMMLWHQALSIQVAAMECIMSITLGGVFAWAVLWYGWLRRTASYYPSAIGALSGIAAAALMASAYALHCNHDNIVYISLFYYAPLTMLAIIGTWIGKRALVW